MLSAVPRATLTPLSCSPNFLRAHYLDIRTLTRELIIVKYSTQSFFHRDHDAPCLPPKKFEYLLPSIFFGTTVDAEELETMYMQNFGG